MEGHHGHVNPPFERTKKRILALLAAAIIGAFGAVAVAAPAQADVDDPAWCASGYLCLYENTNGGGSSIWYSSSFQGQCVNLPSWWNDRISSYIARNWETGSFYTDWFYGGTQWNFCCNSSVYDLGGYSNTFSSVKRT